MLADSIRADVKRYLLSGERQKAETLKGLLSALQYAEVELRSRGQKLDEARIITVLNKEAKKREETAEIYKKAGEQSRYENEMSELETIKQYLPEPVDEQEILKAVKEAIKNSGASEMKDMGRVITEAKKNLPPQADGGQIARIAKQELEGM